MAFHFPSMQLFTGDRAAAHGGAGRLGLRPPPQDPGVVRQAARDPLGVEMLE
jgi:hypothetical protein